MLKKCFKCGRRKKLELFYVHKEMGDGHLGKCKSCTKKDVNKRYYDPEANLRIREYERLRFKDEERKRKVSIYQKKMREKNPGKYRARYAIGHAIASGKVARMPCEVCSEPKSQAHHTDYRKPLQVTWLCRTHHMEAEGKRPWV